MRILAITDLHGDTDALERALDTAGAVDAVLVLGDLSYERSVLRRLYARLGSCGAPVYIIHGNHEDEDDAEELAREYGLRWVHRRVEELDGLSIAGYGGGGFSTRRADLDAFAEELPVTMAHRSIVVTHAPPADTPLDELDGDHVGDKSVRALIERARPIVALSGHLHENFNVGGTLGDTVLLNPGDSGTVLTITKTKQGYALSLTRLS